MTAPPRLSRRVASGAVFPAALLGALVAFGAFFDYLAREEAAPEDYAVESMCLRPHENGPGERSANCEQLAQARVRP